MARKLVDDASVGNGREAEFWLDQQQTAEHPPSAVIM